MSTRLKANARLPITWQACILYAVAFGGYVAFSVYLPAYLKTAYDLTPADAANRMAGFVVLAVIMRPVGGWLADRLGPIPVLAGGYVVVVIGAAVAVHHTGPRTRRSRRLPGDGAGAGLRHRRHLRADRQGDRPVPGRRVTGLVGAAGGLGGFVPPLIMGYVYGRPTPTRSGCGCSSATAASTLLLTLTIVRRTARQHDEETVAA